jgi:small-conductance mechanosensitive channel
MHHTIQTPFRVVLLAGWIVVSGIGSGLAGAQTAPSSPPAQASDAARESAIRQAVGAATVADPAAVLRFSNRDIVEFRATVLNRTPAVRAASARTILEQLANGPTPGAVAVRPFADGYIVSVGALDLFGLVAADLDPASPQTLADAAGDVSARLQLALDEAVELRTPARLVRSIALAAIATVVYLVLILMLTRGHRRLTAASTTAADRQLRRLPGAAIMRASRLLDFLRYLVTVFSFGVALMVTYGWLTFTLRRFPYTRPWGEALRGFLIQELVAFGNAAVAAIPSLFKVVVIVFLTRMAVKLTGLMFEAVKQERAAVPWLYPETAAPTRRLVAALLWLFALAVAFPYLPGSNTDAFKGVSVFIGLMISLGSSGIVNQMMSGLTLTYSRAVREGDFVRIGDIEGTVTHLGGLSLKLKTPRREEVTIPNTVVIGTETINFSRFSSSEGVFACTSVTIGYDTPWRQVKALLLLAAARSSGIRTDPAPAVRQMALEDFYVRYTLFVALEDPAARVPILDGLHGHVLDAFNEHGVQIMSPNYEADPAGPKLVPPGQWHAAPALESDLAGTAPGGRREAAPSSTSTSAVEGHTDAASLPIG